MNFGSSCSHRLPFAAIFHHNQSHCPIIFPVTPQILPFSSRIRLCVCLRPGSPGRRRPCCNPHALAACNSQQAGPPSSIPLTMILTAKSSAGDSCKLDPKDYPRQRACGLGVETRPIWKRPSTSRSQLPFTSLRPTGSTPRPTCLEDTITHDQILATLLDIKNLLRTRTSSPDARSSGVVLLTRLRRLHLQGLQRQRRRVVHRLLHRRSTFRLGGKFRTAEYQYPIYARPHDLSTDPITGKVLRRLVPDSPGADAVQPPQGSGTALV